MMRFVVLAVYEDDLRSDPEGVIEAVEGAIMGLPATVVRPSHHRSERGVELIGWTPEDLRRAGLGPEPEPEPEPDIPCERTEAHKRHDRCPGIHPGDVRVRAVTETNPDGTLARDVHL